MRVSVRRATRAILDEIADEWRALCAEGPCADPRLSPEWIGTYLAAFEPDAHVVLVVVRRDDRLRAVLPLVRQRFGLGPLALRWLRSASNFESSLFDVIHGAHDREDATMALWRFIDRWRDWDVLHLRTVPASGPAHDLARLARDAGCETVVRGTSHAWYLPVDPTLEGVESAIAAQGKSLRQKNRRYLRRLRDAGDVQFRVVDQKSDPALRRRAIDEFYDLEASGWKGRNGTAIIGDPSKKAFYDRLIPLKIASGTCAIRRLELNGTLIASCVGFTAGDRYLDHKIAFDEDHREFTPGHLLTLFTLVDLARKGQAELDLGPILVGEEGYQSRWTDRYRVVATHLVFRPNLRGRLAHRAVSRYSPWLVGVHGRVAAATGRGGRLRAAVANVLSRGRSNPAPDDA